MHLRTQTRILPDHCCRYWNIASNGRAKSLKHFLDTIMAKKPWAIFVDSTILVNGYHIYSTACNYNSSVSNLCFACWDASQVFLVVANFPPFLRPIPCLILLHVAEHVRRRLPSLQDRWPERYHHIIALPLHPSHSGQGLWEKGLRLTSKGQRTYLSVLFHSRPQVWLTDYVARVAVSSMQRPGNWPFPFRGCPWNPQKICAMSGRCPGIHWNYNSHCPNSGWMQSNLLRIIPIT